MVTFYGILDLFALALPPHFSDLSMFLFPLIILAFSD